MLSDAEKILLTQGLQGFPMINAASAAWKRCGVCGHGNAPVNTMLRTAVTLYRNRQDFRKACAQIIKLPCTLGGILVKRGKYAG